MTTLRNFQDVELEVKRTNLEVERLLTDVRLILDRINHIRISDVSTVLPSLVTDHGILSGLGDDDHLQYILVSGTRPFTGDQSHGDFNITNVGDISLDSITADASIITINSDTTFLGTLTIPDFVYHAGDLDTLINFSDDQIILQAGGKYMLTLTEAGQDLITLGPGSGDVDVDFNGDMFLRGSDGRFAVGPGFTSSDGLVHIHTATAGTVAAAAAADELVLENSGNAGMHILNPDTGISSIYMGSPGDQIGAAIAWTYGAAGATSLMSVGTSSVLGQLSLQTGSGLEAVRIDASQNIGINTTNITQKLTFGVSGSTIAMDTADASDNKALKIAGGGSAASSRGAFIELYGNEHATEPGELHINPGGIAGMQVQIDNTLYVGDGKVGIGEIAPDSNLHITTTAFSAFRIERTATSIGSWEIGLTNAWGGGAGSLGLKPSVATGDFNIVDSSNNSRFFVDTSLANIGVNTSNPDGTMHVHTATAGSVTAVGSANELVLENSGDCGLSILAPNTSTSAVVFGSPSDNSGAWVSWNFNSKLFVIGSTTASGEVRINTGAGAQAVYIDSSQNLGIRTSTAFGSGTGVLGIANASANPSTNPSGGGVLYADGGAGKWRSSSGTTTVFGPAEPHCKVCGRDFILEWENKKTGHLIVCMWCLTERLGEEKWITRVN